MKGKLFKKLAAIALTGAMVVTLAACGGGGSGDAAVDGSAAPVDIGSTETPTTSGEKKVLKIPHVETTDSHTQDSLEKFKAAVEEQTNGGLEIQIYPNSELGDEVTILQGMETGTIEMGCLSLPTFETVLDQKYSLFALPFLYDSPEAFVEAEAGPLGDLCGQWIEDDGYVVLGWMFDGSRNFGNNVRPINTPDDCQGIKIRSMDSEVYIQMFKLLGFNPTPMGFSDIYTAVQTGVVDGNDNPPILFYTANFAEVHKYYSLTGHVYSMSTNVIKKEVFDDLPAEYQTILLECGKKYLQDDHNAGTIEMEQEYVDLIAEEGVEVNEVSPENKALFAEKEVPLYTQFKEKVGEDVFEEFEAAVGKELA